MYDYAGNADKAVKKMSNASNGDDLRQGANSLANTAQSFVKDAAGNAGKIASESADYIKNEGKKNLEKAESFIQDHPKKGALYALGLGVLVSYFLLRRK